MADRYPPSAALLLGTELPQWETFCIYRWLGEYFSEQILCEMLIRLHYNNPACSLRRAKTLSAIQSLGEQRKVSQTTPKRTNERKFNSNSTAPRAGAGSLLNLYSQRQSNCLLHYTQLSYQGGFP